MHAHDPSLNSAACIEFICLSFHILMVMVKKKPSEEEGFDLKKYLNQSLIPPHGNNIPAHHCVTVNEMDLIVLFHDANIAVYFLIIQKYFYFH